MDKEINLILEGVTKEQVTGLIRNLNSIRGVKADFHLRDDVFSQIETKETCIPLALRIAENVSSGIIAYFITKFFDKEKSIDREPIMIENKNIQIVQGDSLQTTENKINIIIKNQK